MSFKLILKSFRSKEIQEIKITSHFRILSDFSLYLLSEVDIFLLISENHLQGPGKQCPFSSQPPTPEYEQVYSPYCSLQISEGVDEESLSNNQEIPQVVMISLFL